MDLLLSRTNNQWTRLSTCIFTTSWAKKCVVVVLFYLKKEPSLGQLAISLVSRTPVKDSARWGSVQVQIQGFIHGGGESLSLHQQLREADSVWLSSQGAIDHESLRTRAVGGFLGGFLFICFEHVG